LPRKPSGKDWDEKQTFSLATGYLGVRSHTHLSVGCDVIAMNHRSTKRVVLIVLAASPTPFSSSGLDAFGSEKNDSQCVRARSSTIAVCRSRSNPFPDPDLEPAAFAQPRGPA